MVIQSPIYEIFKIVSADGQTEVSIDDAQFRVTDISYYENILSPNITGKVTIFSTIGAVKSASDTQNRLGSLYSSLPLEVHIRAERQRLETEKIQIPNFIE